jgi:MFS superfamily sulfate permease-like transporter
MIQNDPREKIKKFSLKELGGALGDWGTLIPFVIGYVSIVGLNPAGIFLTLGLTNIILGIKFNLPLPVQPQKTIGTIAISQKWNPSLVISTGFATGIIWLLLGLSKFLGRIANKIPMITVRGIQLGLGLILGWTGITFISDDILLGLFCIIVLLIFYKYKKVPSSIILIGIGILILVFTGAFSIGDLSFGLPFFQLTFPNWNDFLYGMIFAGIAQLFLTLTNVMIATVSLAKELFPEKIDEISADSLAINMGLMNMINPFIQGMPLCHGSGGLAAQYAFGARSGGSMIIEGSIEIILGLFFSDILFTFFIRFPQAILGAMLFYTALLLGRISFKEVNKRSMIVVVVSALFCFFINITIGFFVGLVLYLIFKKILQ